MVFFRAGAEHHSYYSGTPSVMRWPVFRGRLSERRAKSLVEPLLVTLCGAALLPLTESLGMYLIIAAMGQQMSFKLAMAHERTRLMDLRDAFLEQQHTAERFRGGDW